MIWRCPNCGEAFTPEPGRWRCQAGHCFDLAKQGYANLLLPNQKNSREPGDNRDMVMGRRAFLQRGHYRPLAQALAAQLRQYVSERVSRSVTLLDLGCGEGYYLRRIVEQFSAEPVFLECYGLDISREAVKQASRHLPPGHLCVASSFHAPVAAGAVDIALQVFAPVSEAEIQRLLASGGAWLRVSPGPKHLYQLKSALYNRVREHVIPDVPEGFQLLDSREVAFDLHLSTGEDVGNLLAMTPLAWHGSTEARQTLIEGGSFHTQVHFLLQLMTPSAQANSSRDTAE